MKKKIAATTWCTDDYIDIIGLDSLLNSFNYFHPDVDFFVFDSKQTQEAIAKDPWLMRGDRYAPWMMAPSCLPYVEDYDMVIHIDGDSTIVGPLTELFDADEDIIGVRNNNSMNMAGSHRGITIPIEGGPLIPMQKFLNAGLIASNNKNFWYEWHSTNKQIEIETGCSDEQDTLNIIFHSKNYTTKILDLSKSGVSYGVSNLWGTGDNHWESWALLYMKDNKLMLNDPVTQEPTVVKILHQAGGSIADKLNRESGGLRNWIKSVVSDEVRDYLNELTRI
jgi:hypothetical protein